MAGKKTSSSKRTKSKARTAGAKGRPGKGGKGGPKNALAGKIKRKKTKNK